MHANFSPLGTWLSVKGFSPPQYLDVLTLQTLVLESMTLPAMILPCTNPLPDKYFMPRATCWEKLRSSFGITLETETPGLYKKKKAVLKVSSENVSQDQLCSVIL